MAGSQRLSVTPLLLLAALVPAVAVHVAWAVNVALGDLPDCNPYVTGCYSVSAAARAGPGLNVFRALVLPTAALLALSWLLVRTWLVELEPDPGGRMRHMHRIIGILGFTGAVFLVLYATWLGTEGDFYRWLRRQGVVFFFGLTGLAQLCASAVLWPRRRGLAEPLRRPTALLTLLVSVQWGIGMASAFKNLYLPDEALADAVGNILEWGFLWTLAGAQAALGWTVHRSGFALYPVRPGGR